MTRIIGIGQIHGGDDAIGLAVAQRLRDTGVAAELLRDPAELVSLLDTGERIVLIDAVVGRGTPGSVHHFTGDEVARTAAGVGVSSHGIGVGQALALARQLGGSGGAGDVHLVGVGIEAPRGVRPGLSPAVAASIGEAAALVRRIAAE